jgi:mxaK protein
MKNTLKHKNQFVGLALLIGLVGAGYQAYQYRQVTQVNKAILTGEVVSDEYLFLQKYSNAYQQSVGGNYKHAAQSFGQMLEAPKGSEEKNVIVSAGEKAKINYNLANNFFHLGLQRSVNPDGTVHEEAMYAYTQARRAYEQSLKLAPDLKVAKYNLSLLLSIMPGKMKTVSKEQSSMVISNLPQGLP